MIDALVVFWLAGGLRRLVPRRRVAASALVLGMSGARTAGVHALRTAFAQRRKPAPAPARAPPPSRRRRRPRPIPPPTTSPQKATADTRLAYIVTGDAEVDDISKAGLQGLTLFLAQRTALEAGEPVGLDPARDELVVLPADLLADRAGRAEPFAGRARAHRQPT